MADGDRRRFAPQEVPSERGFGPAAGQALHRLIVDGSTDLIWLLEPDGTIGFASPSASALTGHAPSFWIGRSVFESIHPADATRWRTALDTALAGEPAAVSYRIRHANGSWRWFEGWARRVRLRGVERVLTALRDVTDRKQDEELLAGQTKVLELIAAGAPLEETLSCLARAVEARARGMLCSVLLLDEDGVHMRHGASPSLPQSYTNAVDGQPIGPSVGSCGTAMFTRAPVIVHDIQTDPLWAEFRELAAAHALRACWSIPILSSRGGVLGSFAMYYSDVRIPSAHELGLLESASKYAGIAIERKRADQALRKTEQRLHLALHVGKIETFEWVLGGTPTRGAEGRGLGAERERPSFVGSIHPQDRKRFEASLARLTQESPEHSLEYRLLRPDGGVLWLEERSRAAFDRAGSLKRLTGVVVDVTQRKHLEDELRHAQKLESVGRLAGGIAHDFNNLLTVINGCAELVLSAPESFDTAKTLVQQIAEAGERAAGLTRQLLAFSRKQVLHPVNLDPNEVVRDIEQLLRRLVNENVTLVTELEPEPCFVRVDRGQLEQVLLNLAVNARDAMPEGGRLAIRTENVELDESAALPLLGPCVCLSVEDSGTGMDDEVMAHLFEPFFTTKDTGQGTGLGLSTVYGIVRQSGGHIDVWSRPGEGARFRILLPRVEGVLVPQPPHEKRPESETRKLTLLVVEDEEAVRELACQILLRGGHAVLRARNGLEALELSRAQVGPIDLLVTDLVMPGMGGQELARVLRQERPGLGVLFVSGYSESVPPLVERRERMLVKPFGPSSLETAVWAALEAGVRR